jgi:hypothetical protein
MAIRLQGKKIDHIESDVALCRQIDAADVVAADFRHRMIELWRRPSQNYQGLGPFKATVLTLRCEFQTDLDALKAAVTQLKGQS